jgi:hypothetical protein
VVSERGYFVNLRIGPLTPGLAAVIGRLSSAVTMKTSSIVIPPTRNCARERLVRANRQAARSLSNGLDETSNVPGQAPTPRVPKLT